ncbi:TetR/AcrR family transcriptional regulator [Microbacterium testaceum]|uniref:TetR family transcriptional regulator n=1 Tax=Microbacterium testaceum TaxID=2033 RepID=A0A4Y3QPF3_MICTE|nr:TetR/AcrR family transcriptional regulator [Microbacterium testaceum]GEB45980.1 TetR family transcriptional regulator [Microbacterium testaceum]
MSESRLPPAPTLRERRRIETMALIEAAAADLFEAQGYEQTTVEQIADRAGISMRTFYRHCPSKDGTLVGELADGPATFIRHLAAHLPGPLLSAVVEGFAESTAVEPEMRRRLTRIIVQTPALRASWLAAGRQAQDDLVELFRRERPELGPLAVRGLAAATIASLTMAVESWALGESPTAREAAVEALGAIAPALAGPLP